MSSSVIKDCADDEYYYDFLSGKQEFTAIMKAQIDL